jgi:hypothetical protein
VCVCVCVCVCVSVCVCVVCARACVRTARVREIVCVCGWVGVCSGVFQNPDTLHFTKQYFSSKGLDYAFLLLCVLIL